MPRETYTEVTRQSWGSRLGGAFKGILFGFLLVFIALVVLFKNEGRAVLRHKSLMEGSGAVVSVAAGQVDPANEGKLVHVSAMAETADVLTDPQFGVAVNAIHLERTVEMYQWREVTDSETKKKVGGGTETTTTYSYRKDWANRSIDSSGFKIPDGHQNPGVMPFADRKVSATDVRVGAFRLSPGLISRISGSQPLPVRSLDLLPAELRWKARLYSDGVYLGGNPASPAIGDVRVSFAYVQPATVSIAAQQVGGSFGPYPTRAGGSVELLRTGAASAEAMFEGAIKGNRVNTWIWRVVGFLVMLFGIKRILRPLSVMADVLPALGNIVETGSGFFATSVALFLASVTIAVAWLYYRPLLALTLLALAVAAVVAIVLALKKARRRVAVTPPPPAPAS